ncbi:MAG: hypothetical protein HY788_21945 [Deltaproteobacteria bacterium]|nr:hypothetical protein [Deltaproteobacteria bacterium]
MARYRIIVAECSEQGDQGHQVAGALRDSGIEVIYMGATSDVVALCCAAIQEDADAVVLVLSDVSDERAQALSGLKTFQSCGNVPDIPLLGVGSFKQSGPPAGLRAVFPPDRVPDALIEWIKKEARSER